METVKQCREDGYRGKLKKENEDDDVERDIEDWINGDRRRGEQHCVRLVKRQRANKNFSG